MFVFQPGTRRPWANTLHYIPFYLSPQRGSAIETVQALVDSLYAQTRDVTKVAPTIRSQLRQPEAELGFGGRARAQPGLGWRCQKQPCTKITFLCFGKTISGFPGRLGTWSRNLYPKDRAIFLTKSSGFVFFPWMSAMRLLRSVRVSVSI